MTLSSGSLAGIVVGALVGLVLLALFAFYLLRRCRPYAFTRVANPTTRATHDLPIVDSWTAKHHIRHSQRPSVSSEPLISPVSWPPLPPTSRIHSVTPPRSYSASPYIKDGQFNSAEIVASRSGTPTLPPAPIIEKTPSQQTHFIHRVLQSRAQASEAVSLVHNPSITFVQSSISTLDSSAIRADVEQLLVDAERSALQDAERAQRGEDWEEMESTESVYSQPSASLDHSLSFKDSVSVRHQKSGRKQSRNTELAPVMEGRCDSPPPNSLLDAQISHETALPPIASVVDQSEALPLLTSGNFGKDSTTSGSITSTAGWGSSSSGRASRYPSIAPSSLGQPSQPGPHSDGDTDWRHPPPGLSSLQTLQIGPMQNPYSPVDEQALQSDTSTPDKRAHLRAGTASSIPEVERRTVVQGGIAHIDVVF